MAGIHLLESFKYPLVIFRGNSNSFVTDFVAEPTFSRFCFRHRRLNLDDAFFTELDRVVDQFMQDLLDAQRISKQPSRERVTLGDIEIFD